MGLERQGARTGEENEGGQGQGVKPVVAGMHCCWCAACCVSERHAMRDVCIGMLVDAWCCGLLVAQHAESLPSHSASHGQESIVRRRPTLNTHLA